MKILPSEIHSVLNCFHEPAIVLNRHYEIVAANAAYKQLYQSHGDLTGQYCYQISHHFDLPCDQSGESCPLRSSEHTGKPQRCLHLHYTPHGREHVDVATVPLLHSDGQIHYFIEILRHTKIAATYAGGAALVGVSPAFNRMLSLLQRVAPTETTVLLLGESGTGKELTAQAIHAASNHAEGALVPVDCSGLAETLFESELFGHEKGAFTGAYARHIGLVEAAAGGTLFLDEIGDVPLSMQVKLLRLLESNTFRRVGSNEPQAAKFRLVCATHRDLTAMVQAGEFRQDLYYRISAFPIRLPPLRERLEDLPLLAETLLQRLYPTKTPHLSADALQVLRQHSFPGNIRELRNIVERASLLSDDGVIKVQHLPDFMPGYSSPELLQGATVLPLAAMEQRYLRWAMQQHQGDRASLAVRLGMSERTLYRKLRTAFDAESSGQ